MKTVSYKKIAYKLLVENWPNPFMREVFFCSRLELPFVAIKEVLKLIIKLIIKFSIIAILPLSTLAVFWYSSEKNLNKKDPNTKI